MPTLREERIDWIYDTVDHLMHAGHFDAVDTLLDHVNVSKEKTELAELISWLTITLPAIPLLKRRDAFYERVRQRILVEAPDRITGLLGGLGPESTHTKGDSR